MLSKFCKNLAAQMEEDDRQIAELQKFIREIKARQKKLLQHSKDKLRRVIATRSAIKGRTGVRSPNYGTRG